MAPPEPIPAGACIVYIVDDDPAVRTAMQLLARCCGWRAQAFESGLTFLDASLENRRACILLDLNMPKMDGEEVLRRLRSRGSILPVLVITGDRQGARLERARRLGAQDVLEKPFGEDAFRQSVQACLDQAPAAAETR